MLYTEFKQWQLRNKPIGMADYDFLEFCALVGALTITKTIESDNITIDELISRFFQPENSLN